VQYTVVLDDSGIESRWRARFFRTYLDRPWGPSSLLYDGYRAFPGGKERPRRDTDPPPLLVPWSRKSRATYLLPLWTVRPVQSLSACTSVHFTFTYTSTPPMGHKAWTEPQCLYKGALYLYLYLYSSYRPYGLYRASVHVQWCTLPLPIPLLPLWTVRPVQSLSACTMVHFTFTYTSTPPMGRTARTEPQCLYSTAIPLLPLWTVRTVQSLSACTTVHFTFLP